MEDIPMPFSAKGNDDYVAQKKMESSLRKQSSAAVEAYAKEVEGMQPKRRIMMGMIGYASKAPANAETSDHDMLSPSASVTSPQSLASLRIAVMNPHVQQELQREDWQILVAWMVNHGIGRLDSYQYAQTLMAGGVCSMHHLASKYASAGRSYLTGKVGMAEDHASFVEQGLADDYPECISAEETAIMKQWLMGTAGVSKSLSFG